MDLLLYILVFLVASVIASLAFIYIRVHLDPLKKVPGAKFTNPIFGNYIDYMKEDCCLLEPLKRYRDVYGTIRTNFLFFGVRRLYVADPYWIKHILVTNSKNYKRGGFPGAENIFFAVGENGLVVVNGEKHKKLRKLATPAFKLSSLKKVMPIIEMCGERMVKLFRMRCDENKGYFPDGEKTTEIGVKEILNKTTLDVIGLIAFGHDFKEACTFDKGTFGCHLREWLDSGQNVTLASIVPFQIPIKKCLITIAKFLPLFMKQSGQLKLSHITTLIHNLVNGVVQSKIEEKREHKQNGVVENSSSKTLLDFMLDASDAKDVSPKEVHDLLMTFLIAGHETSTLTITWTLYLLAKHPEYQQKCREEAIKFFNEHKDHVEWDDVHKLTFMNAVVHESLRLYPPVPWLQRYPIEPDKFGDYDIPANCDTVVIICEMQTNADYWPNPYDFIPERFLEPHDSIPWEAYMPFGDGVHKCIGYPLALTEVNYFMAVLLKNFDFSIDNSVQYKDRTVLVMQPKPELKLRIKVLP